MQQQTKKQRPSLQQSSSQKTSAKQQVKLKPSQLVQKQLAGSIFDDGNPTPKIIQFQNLADFSTYTTSIVPVNEPLFEPIPPIIQFTDYEPLQIKEKIFKLRNKDKFARRVKIFKPDSRLFQVVPLGANGKEANPDKAVQKFGGTKVAPGMETNFIIRFSPEAKTDYNYDVVVETEREKFVVPIVAVGKRAMIDFPDQLDFGNCPVKYATEKPVIIRNLGEKTTKWFLRLPTGFDADKTEGVLEFGKNEQIVIKFFPTEAKSYKNEAILQYDNMEAYVPITGTAHNGNVYLSKSYIQMDDAYIGLQTQQTLQIINKSNVKVNFEWRAFATEKEEQEKKNRLRVQLEEEEAEERMLIKELVSNEAVHEEFELEENEDSEEEERDEKALILKKQKKAELMLARKYKNIRKAIEDDMLLFQDDIFSIEPVSGQIWPNSEMTITVTFVPKGALHYSTVSYCNISCSEERLALNLSGEGIGPKAFLSVYEVNLGDVFVNELHKTEVIIENRGEIECRFELLPNERAFGKMFKFDIEKGILGVGQRIPFTISFQSSIPGEFKETFRWRLEGSADQLTILFIGHVIAPTFHFDVERINFGAVSYSFQYTEKIRLTNTSTVDFTYSLRIPGDGKLSQKEFEIEPQKDIIKCKKSKEIFVTFIPKSTKVYEMVMVVDIEGVGQDMLSIPITADAQVPKVEIKPADVRLDFGEIFLRHADILGVQLINNSDLKAKFQVLPQNDEYKVLAKYTVDPESGIIEKNSSATISVCLTTKKLGDIGLPLQINIVGSNNGLPHILNIVACSIGPIVDVGTKELDFKEVVVLEDYRQKVTITNKSKIEADFHAFTKNKVSIFKPMIKHGLLQPSESMDIEVLCNADDAVKVQDILHFVIKEGVDVDVVLKAKGIGSTLFCKEKLEIIKFDPEIMFTHRKSTTEIFIENKGRKPQKLTWARKQEKEKKKDDDITKKKPQQVQTPEEEPVFSVVPETVTLQPKHGIMFQFRAFSTRLGTIEEIFQLQSQVGTERKSTTLHSPSVQGMFIKPTLRFSEKRLFFKYSWEKNVPFSPIARQLEMACESRLPCNFKLACSAPFRISHDEFKLIPDEKAIVIVYFDPGYKTDRKSGEQEGKLTITHFQHPHRDIIDLVGSVNFPNIALDTQTINFGSILNDTTKKMVLTMKNISEMRLDYEWTFLQEELVFPPGTSGSQQIESRDSQRTTQKSIPINEIFDILPLSGSLEPGHEEQVEFVYNAFGGQRFKTQAICHVDGGPEYEVSLVGDSSLVTYSISIPLGLIDCGEVKYCEWVSKEFFITNTGKVTFEYKVSLHTVKKKGFVDVQPMSGRIAGGDKQRLVVRVSPALPAEFKEVILVSVGYYEPEPITIIGKGVYPSILINQPRAENPMFQQKFEQEMAKKKQEQEAQQKRAQLLQKAQQQDKKQQVAVKSLEQIQLEVERDIDRYVFCEQIKKVLADREREKLQEQQEEQKTQQMVVAQQSRTASDHLQKTGEGLTQTSKENRIYDKIFLATYVCDFGNVVINSVKSKQIKVYNSGSLQVDFTLDRKYYQNQGYMIQPERVSALPPGEEATLTIQYQTKKTMKFGKTKTVIPIEVKKGSKYYLELNANITIPRIKIENIEDSIDFGKVLIGQRKTFFIRLINDKEITCEWQQVTRQELAQGEKKEEPRFTLVPNNGHVQPGQKQVVEVWFTPLLEKVYQQKFTLNVKENTQPFILNVKGQGVAINLDLKPQQLNIGPVLPYADFAYTILEVRNPSDYDTELISLDYDTVYQQDEEMLTAFQPLESSEFVLMKVRNPGDALWEDVQKGYKRRKQREELQAKIQSPEFNEEAKAGFKQELEELIATDNEVKVEYPRKVEDDVMRHVLIMGTPKSGKTALLQHLQSEHKRKVVNLDQLVEWNQENNTEAYTAFLQWQTQRQNEIKLVEQEREKLLKKAGKKSKELEDKWGPIPLHLYTYVSEDVLKKLIAARIAHEDCNAGVMFDNLHCDYWPNELYLMKCLLEVVGEKSLQIVILKEQHDSHGLDICKVIEWEGMQDLALKDEDKEKPVANEEELDAKNRKGKATKREEKKPKEKEQPKLKQEQPKLKQQEQKVEGKSNNRKQTKSSVRKSIIKEQGEVTEEQSYFTVFAPGSWRDEMERQAMEEAIQKVQDLVGGRYKAKIELSKIHDPVFEEGKKEEKPVGKAAKKGDKPLEEEVKPVEEVIDYSHLLKGPREVSVIPLHYNLEQLYRTGLNVIPAPIYPDPNTLPVADPVYQQLVYKVRKGIMSPDGKYQPTQPSVQLSTVSPRQRGNQPNQTQTNLSASQLEKASQLQTLTQNTTKYFSILTPKDPFVPEKEIPPPPVEPVEEQKVVVDGQKPGTAAVSDPVPVKSKTPSQIPRFDETIKDETTKVLNQKESKDSLQKEKKAEQSSPKLKQKPQRKKDDKKEDDQANVIPEPKYQYKREDLINGKSRWVIPHGRTLILVVKFFTKTTGQFEGRLNFENFFGLKKYSIDVKGVSDFPQVSTLPKSIFWNVKKSRPLEAPASYLSRVFVQSESLFDFGPLLVGKNSSDKVSHRNVNSSTFRISNQGKFDADIKFALLSTVIEDAEQKKGIFQLEQEGTPLGLNSLPFELRIWAFPDAPQRFRDDLIVMVKDNPLPLIIPLVCIGCRPTVEIQKDGELLKFDKLLLNQAASKTIIIKNTGMIGAKWRLSGLDHPEEFKVVNTAGELAPTQEARIDVTFKAIKERKVVHKLVLEVEDVEQVGIKQDPKTITLDAEGFDITVDLKFPDNNQDNLLDFGSIKVGDYKDATFLVKNTGLYRVKFAFVMKKKLFKEMFKVEPSEMELDPNQTKEILVRFIATKELKLKTNQSTTDLTMEILEGKTLELFKPVPINVSFNAVFSKFSILPIKSINFGPIQFNENKTRLLEIKNEGQFEFSYTIFDYNNDDYRKQLQSVQDRERQEKVTLQQLMPSQMAPVDPKQKGAKKDTKDDKKAAAKGGKPGKNDPPPGQLKIGQWTLTPALGTIAPDSSATVEINFAGQGQKNYEQKLAIDITGRDPADQPQGILYEVVSESCIPGINTDNYETIFEEQVVIQTQSSTNNITSLINSNVFFIEEKIFFFGTLVPSKVPEGIVERFKLTNPNKVPCTVRLDVRKRNPNNPNENFAFEIQPKSVKIAPHESTYVKVAFKPTIMAQYFGIFEALVENGEQNPRTHKLYFDVRGEGALPTLKLERPKDWLDERTPLLKFGRVRVGKSVTMPIILKNDGQVPATVKWDVQATNENFRFLDQNTLTLTPKTSATFNIEFIPREPGAKQWYLMMQTLLNPYEITRIAVAGEAFFEEIIFEGLPNDLEDEVIFGDCVINNERKVHFQVRNNGSNPIRFAWNTQGSEDFVFQPRLGHLAAGQSKPIQLFFKSNKSVTHKQYATLCDTKTIKQAGYNFQEWDDTMSTQRYVTATEYNWIMKRREEEEARRREEEAAAANQNKKGAKKQDKKAGKQQEEKKDQPPPSDPNEDANVPISDPIPEPDHQAVDKSDKAVTLKVTATADFTKYEIESRSVYFKPTLMYTTRTHQLKLRNTSLISLKYTCKIVSAATGVIDPGYFYIYPKNGSVAPNCDEQFTVKFSPTEIENSNERLLVISIEHLDPNQEKLIIELDGEAERPVCHFELPPNKYREKKPDLDAKYNVIEFESLGTKIKNTKRFYVVNPTSVGYEYEWRKLEDDKLPMGASNQYASYFKCLQPKGVVHSGKKGEMIFEYNADQVGTHESFWTFEIPAEKIVQYFLVVGTVVEPNIIFDVGKVNFGPLLVQGRNKETVILKNLEDVPIAFNFERDSVRGDPDYADSLHVAPMSGVVRPLGDQPIEIQFAPKVERDYNYNLVCNVKRRSRPITLNVKGTGYVLHHSVFLQQTVVTNDQPTSIDFGDIYINEKKVRTLTIDNKGDFNFDFSLRKHNSLSFIQLLPENGTVKKNEKFQINVVFQPIAPYKLNQGHNQIHLAIVSGPTYTFILNGNAKKPGVDFSFQSYDFGPCFVLKQPLPITKVLELRNRDTSAMAIETNFEKKPHFDVQLASGQVILPLQIETSKDKKGLIQTRELNVLKIPITFTPRECTKYDESVIVDINGLHKIEVKIIGEGIPLKLELDKSEDQNIDFGVFSIGQAGTRSVFLMNQSQKTINISFDIDTQLKDIKQKNFIKVRPKREIQINPRERKEIVLIFKPSQRLHAFKKELCYKIVDNNEVRKLLTVAGACHGVELKLMEDTCGFGAVVVNSKLSKTVQLANLGDVGAKFNWDTSLCKNYFTITPQSGTLPAHEDLYFEVTFHPNVVDNDIRFNKVKCNIQNSEPLYLNLLGKCIDQPKDLVQEVRFDTVVRTPIAKKVTIKNPTAKPWKVKATVNALLPQFREYFEGKEYLEVAPNAQVEYEIIYKPLTMTSNPQAPAIKDEQHEGTLFFPLPDGLAMLYNLIGKSLPPTPIQTIDLAIKAKKSHIQILPIKNWLKSVQRFNIQWILEPEDLSIILNGANTFDVSGEGLKEYKLAIYGLKAAQNKTTIYFRNSQTNEFIFFKLNLTIQPPDPLQRIEMTSMVREAVSKLITIENPLNTTVDIKKEQLLSDTDNVSFNPPSFSIPARSEFGLEIIYRPLLAIEQNSKITLKSVELGEFVYPLKLQGLPVNTMRTIYYKAPLGTDVTLPYKFLNYTKKPTTYQCVVTKLGNNGKPVPVAIDPKAKGAPVSATDFNCEVAQVQAPGVEGFEGVDVQVAVKFEPSSLSESRGVLILQSPDGGEYQCLLVGQGLPPQPKGPFKLAGAKPPTIDFKNPFFEAQEFTLRIDNPAFSTSVKSPVKIDGKKVINIAVVYKAVQGGTNNGRLIISTGELPQWVFYLQGE